MLCEAGLLKPLLLKTVSSCIEYSLARLKIWPLPMNTDFVRGYIWSAQWLLARNRVPSRTNLFFRHAAFTKACSHKMNVKRRTLSNRAQRNYPACVQLATESNDGCSMMSVPWQGCQGAAKLSKAREMLNSRISVHLPSNWPSEKQHLFRF